MSSIYKKWRSFDQINSKYFMQNIYDFPLIFVLILFLSIVFCNKELTFTLLYHVYKTIHMSQEKML